MATETTVADFLRSKHINPDSGSSRRATTGWLDERGKVRQEIARKARLETVQKGTEAVQSMDAALFAIAEDSIAALAAYVKKKGTLTPGEAKTVMEMVLLRSGLPTAIQRDEIVEPPYDEEAIDQYLDEYCKQT